MKIMMVNRALCARSAGEAAMFLLADELESMGHQVSWFARDHKENKPLPDSYVVEYQLRDSKRQHKKRRFFDADVKSCMRDRLREDRPDMALVWQLDDLTWAAVEGLFEEYIPTYVMMQDYAPLCLKRNLNRNDACCTLCAEGHFRSGVIHRCVQGSLVDSCRAYEEERFRRRKKVYDLPWGYIVGSEHQKELLMKSGFMERPVMNLGLPVVIPPEEELMHRRGRYFLYVGMMEKAHGAETLIRAMQQTVTDMQLVMVGDGEKFRALRDLAAELKAENKIRFMGRLRSGSLRQVMRECHCMVVPSQSEEIAPWALLNAMALGKPAIVSRFGVLPERVTEDENGWVFPAGNVSALAQQLDDMADLPEEDYLKMCDKARAKAVEEYDVRAYAERILALDRYNGNEA